MKAYSLIFAGLLSLIISVGVYAQSIQGESVSDAMMHSMIQNEEYADVIGMLEKLPDDERTWQTYYWLGTVYLLQNRLLDAAHALDYALELRGNIAEIWVQRAVVEQERGNFSAALRLLNVAQEVKPECIEIYFNAAYAYEHLGETEAAGAAYGHYLKVSAQEPGTGRLRQLALSRLTNISVAADKNDHLIAVD